MGTNRNDCATKLFVGGLAAHTNNETLRQVFSPFGHVSDVEVVLDQTTGVSRGFAFVAFLQHSCAQEAAHQLNGSQLDGGTIRVSRVDQRNQEGDDIAAEWRQNRPRTGRRGRPRKDGAPKESVEIP